ncbi:hypothetical protein MBLNU457_7832t1 [Dothideomycetes sp. NU457]
MSTRRRLVQDATMTKTGVRLPYFVRDVKCHVGLYIRPDDVYSLIKMTRQESALYIIMDDLRELLDNEACMREIMGSAKNALNASQKSNLQTIYDHFDSAGVEQAPRRTSKKRGRRSSTRNTVTRDENDDGDSQNDGANARGSRKRQAPSRRAPAKSAWVAVNDRPEAIAPETVGGTNASAAETRQVETTPKSSATAGDVNSITATADGVGPSADATDGGGTEGATTLQVQFSTDSQVKAAEERRNKLKRGPFGRFFILKSVALPAPVAGLLREIQNNPLDFMRLDNPSVNANADPFTSLEKGNNESNAIVNGYMYALALSGRNELDTVRLCFVMLHYFDICKHWYPDLNSRIGPVQQKEISESLIEVQCIGFDANRVVIHLAEWYKAGRKIDHFCMSFGIGSLFVVGHLLTPDFINNKYTIDGGDQAEAFARLHQLGLGKVVKDAGLDAVGQTIRDAFMAPFLPGDQDASLQDSGGDSGKSGTRGRTQSTDGDMTNGDSMAQGEAQGEQQNAQGRDDVGDYTNHLIEPLPEFLSQEQNDKA